MQEKQLRLYSTEKTFFSRITKSITRLLLPGKVGINSFVISLKRNNLLRSYENYIKSLGDENLDKEELKKKHEDMYVLYLEAIDKHIIDHMYKKIKNNTADDFEKNTLAKYYTISQIKDNDITEYKFMKQKFLIDLDYETIDLLDKPKLMEDYKVFYIDKVELLYKKLLKNYSIKLSDAISTKSKDEIYKNIFKILEDYIVSILPEKMSRDKDNKYENIMDDCENLEKYSVGKLDKVDLIYKKLLLIGISRNLFTHSLPLSVSERCYIRLLKETRNLITETMNPIKRDKVYNLLLNVIEQYNLKLLSTKIYWDKPQDRAEYKGFWDRYKEIQNIDNKEEQFKQKQILFLKADLNKVYQKESEYKTIIIFYKCKLVALGAMRNIKNSCKSEGTYKSSKQQVKEKI
ncbi:MAG: hypothetical protein Q4G05_04980 [Clostridia bacterium]|nr:hypothetical protein [Clostridia bacterium]